MRQAGRADRIQRRLCDRGTAARAVDHRSAAFELQDARVALIEVAPGIDIKKDIVAHVGFVPKMVTTIKPVLAELLQPKWGGLSEIFQANRPPVVKAAA